MQWSPFPEVHILTNENGRYIMKLNDCWWVVFQIRKMENAPWNYTRSSVYISSWLAKQEIRGLTPGLAATISEIENTRLGSHYTWNAKLEGDKQQILLVEAELAYTELMIRGGVWNVLRLKALHKSEGCYIPLIHTNTSMYSPLIWAYFVNLKIHVRVAGMKIY